VTTITGNSTAIHVVSFDSPTATILSGFRIINSNPGGAGGTCITAGVCRERALTIRNNIIEHNSAASQL